MFRHAHPATQRGYKRRARANAHQLFASEPSLSVRISESVYRQLQCWCYGTSAEVAIQCCCFSDGVLQLFKLRSRRNLPCALQHFSKRVFFFLKRANSKRAPRATGVFLKMASRSCVSGCGRFLASSDGHDRCVSCLGYQHAEAALVHDSCSLCGNMTIAMLRSRYLLVKRGGIPLAMPRSSSSGSRRATSAHGQGDLRITVRASPSSASPRASHSSSASHHLGFPDELVESSDRAGPSISFRAPADDRMSITASGDELGSGDDDSAALPPSGRVVLPESDPELTAMLSRAAESVGLQWRPPPSPERSRLDDWFLGAQADRRQPPPVPFFPEVHEVAKRHLFLPGTGLVPPPSSPPSTVGRPKGMWRSPQVERAIAMQLCPQGATTWRGDPSVQGL